MPRFENINYEINEYDDGYFIEFKINTEDVRIPITWGEDAKQLIRSYVRAVTGRDGKVRTKRNVQNDVILSYLITLGRKIYDTRNILEADIEVLHNMLTRDDLDPQLIQDVNWLIKQLIPGEYRIPVSYLNVLNDSTKINDTKVWTKVYHAVEPSIHEKRQYVDQALTALSAVYEKHKTKKIVVEKNSITKEADPMYQWYGVSKGEIK